MKPSTDLFDLIQSLSPTEKRYFHRSSGVHVKGGENNYLRLFHAIDEQGTYDEEALRDRFRGEKFIQRLPSEKNYLFRAILKAMRQYRAENSVAIQIKDLLLDAAFLEDRGLYRPGQKMLAKARKLAEQYEQWPELIEVLFREKRLLLQMGKQGMEEELEEKIEATEMAMGAYHGEIRNHDVYYQLFMRARMQYQTQEKASSAELEQILKAANPPEETSPDAFFVQLKYLHAQAFHAQLVGESGDAYTHFVAAAQLWESRPDLKKAFLTRAMGNLANVLSLCHQTGKYGEMRHWLEELKQWKPGNWDEEGEWGQNQLFFESLYFMSVGDLTGLKAHEQAVEALMERFHAKIPRGRRAALYYNLMSAHFCTENPARASHWANAIMDGQLGDQRQDIQIAARLFLLVMYAEREDHSLVESVSHSLTRSRRRRKVVLPLEKPLLEFAKGSLKGENREKGQRKLVKRLENEAIPKGAIGRAELLAWAQARLSQKSIPEVLHLKMEA